MPTGSTDMVVRPARRCRAVVQALEGFWRTDGRHTEMPTALDAWLVTPVTAARPIPYYLELSGTGGTLRIYLTGFDSLTP